MVDLRGGVGIVLRGTVHGLGSGLRALYGAILTHGLKQSV
jgi:hypothetical protein